MSDLDTSFGKAIKKARPTGDAKEIARLSKTLESLEWGTTPFGDVRVALWRELDAGLRAWIRRYTSQTAKPAPADVVWFYRNALESDPTITLHVVHDILFGGPQFEKVARQTLASLKGKSVGGERKKIEVRFPEYPRLLNEIREAKRVWNAADAYLKTTPEFKVMGGLVRIGTPESVRYHDLVKRAQEMERAALGKVLTSKKKTS